LKFKQLYRVSHFNPTGIALKAFFSIFSFICIICLFIAWGILFYLYKRHKYSRPSKVIRKKNLVCLKTHFLYNLAADVITITSMSQSQNFNDPISFLHLSSPPPSYTNVFTNIAE